GVLRPAAQHCARRIDVIRTADEERRTLVELGGLDVEDALVTIRCGTPCLFDDEGERTGLVKKTQLAPLVLAIGWISEKPAAQQVAMKVSDKRADIAGIHRLSVSILATIVPHQILDVRLPLAVIGIVDREISTDIGGPYVRMREEKLTQRRIQRESVRALTSRINQHRAGT